MKLKVEEKTGAVFPEIYETYDDWLAFLNNIDSLSAECIELLFWGLEKYQREENNGFLLRLPCPEGSIVYVIIECNVPFCEACEGHTLGHDCVKGLATRIIMQEFDIQTHYKEFGKSVFLTYKDALDHLRGRG